MALALVGSVDASTAWAMKIESSVANVCMSATPAPPLSAAGSMHLLCKNLSLLPVLDGPTLARH
ncbi:MAG: hypothetical protein RL701_651 [Pseudomonadota bacterium]